MSLDFTHVFFLLPSVVQILMSIFGLNQNRKLYPACHAYIILQKRPHLQKSIFLHSLFYCCLPSTYWNSIFESVTDTTHLTVHKHALSPSLGSLIREELIKIDTSYFDKGIRTNISKVSHSDSIFPSHTQPKDVFFFLSKLDIYTEECVRRLVHHARCSSSAFLCSVLRARP